MLPALSLAILVAQDPAATPAGPAFLSPVVLIAGMFMLFYVIVLAPERRKKAEEANMLSKLKKNDRVVTVGGIHGTIAAITEGSDVVTLKLDEAGTTRIKINRSAIGQVVVDEQSKEAATKK
ncbi:MAG: preprotein translocase subunit YajC [Planctomycetota bacterium]